MPAEALASGGTEIAARTVLSELFVAGRRPLALAAMALWSICSVAFAVGAGRRRKPGRASGHASVSAIPAVAILAIVAMSAAAAAFGSAPAGLYSIVIPQGSGEAPLLLETTGHDSYRDYFWAATGRAADDSAARSLRFIGIRSPVSAAVPVSAFDGYRRIRFRMAPVIVTGPGGRPYLAAAPFQTAWGLHE